MEGKKDFSQKHACDRMALKQTHYIFRSSIPDLKESHVLILTNVIVFYVAFVFLWFLAITDHTAV